MSTISTPIALTWFAYIKNIRFSLAMRDFGQVPSFPKGGLGSNLYKLEDIQKKVGHVHVLYILAGVNALNVAWLLVSAISSNSRKLNCCPDIILNMKYS